MMSRLALPEILAVADLISVGMAAWGKASVREQDSVQEELAVLDGVLSAALMAMVSLLE